MDFEIRRNFRNHPVQLHEENEAERGEVTDSQLCV
jgi:hypothetical protein